MLNSESGRWNGVPLIIFLLKVLDRASRQAETCKESHSYVLDISIVISVASSLLSLLLLYNIIMNMIIIFVSIRNFILCRYYHRRRRHQQNLPAICWLSDIKCAHGILPGFLVSKVFKNIWSVP